MPSRAKATSVAVALLLMTPAAALAHPLIDQGRRLYEEADFEGSLELLERAERATDLGRRDVLELLELRALIGRAVEEEPLLSESLRSLAALEPDHTFRPEVPPEIVERFRALDVAPLRLDARARAEGDGVQIEATVGGEQREELLRQVVIRGRAPQGRWSRAIDEPLHLPSEGGAVEWYVEVIGIGGAVLLHQGSAEAPERLEPESDPDPEPHRERRRRPWVWGVIAGAVVVVAGVVLAATLASGGDDELPTTINGPFWGGEE